MFKFANFLFFLLITSLYGANTLSSGLTLTTNDLNSFILGTTFPPDKNPQDLDNGKTPSALNGLISCQQKLSEFVLDSRLKPQYGLSQ